MNGTYAQSGAMGTVMKPIGEFAKIIEQTSPADMLLFLIALDRKERADAAERFADQPLIIGKND